MNLTIHLSQVAPEENGTIYSTQYNRWTPDGRGVLFSNLDYLLVDPNCFLFPFAIPKLQSKFDNGLLKKIKDQQPLYTILSTGQTKQRMFYRTAGGRYFKIFSDREFGSESKSNKDKCLQKEVDVHEIIAVLSSSLWWVYYTLHFDMYNCKDYMMYNFRYNPGTKISADLIELGKKLCKDMYSNAERKLQVYKSTGSREQLLFRPSLSKPIIDEIDELLAKHYGFTEEELDFIINYDIKYRMGDELNAEE